jgi:hypothetical protein
VLKASGDRLYIDHDDEATVMFDDRIAMRVTVQPAATIDFGERNTPAGAVDIDQRRRAT